MMKFLLPVLMTFSFLSAHGEREERAPIDPSSAYVVREESESEEVDGFSYFYPQQIELPKSFNAYPGFIQAIAYFKSDGSGFELVDGSRYSIAWVDQGTLRRWSTNDLVVLFPCQEWFSFFELKAVNITKGSEVKVRFVEGPLLNSPYLKIIQAIDPYTRTVRLSDGSVWGIWEGDEIRFSKWLIGDVVMTGCSFSPNGDAILFNVTTPDAYRKYSFATFLGY